MQFETLPGELLEKIFAYIPYKDILLHASIVCSFFHEVISDASLWKFLIVQDFKVSFKHVQDPKNWQTEYAFHHTQWEKITTAKHMVVDPTFLGEIELIYTPEGTVQITNKLTKAPGDIITIQSPTPIRPLPKGDFSMGYFETTLLNGGDEQRIGIGLARKGHSKGMPGWEKGSCGFHADDGKFFNSLDYGLEVAGPWKVGDICGCGVDFRRNNIFFTQNGNLLVAFPFEFITLGLYVTIGTQRNGESVEVNFGQKTFAFDILQYQSSFDDYVALTVPYSTLAPVFNERPKTRADQFEDWTYQAHHLALDSSMKVFSSLMHLVTHFPQDSASFQRRTEELKEQLEAEDISLPSEYTVDDLRVVLYQYVNNKRLFRMIELMDSPSRLNILDTVYDEYSSQLLKCINVLSFNYPPNHLMTTYTYTVLKDLTPNFTPPEEDSLISRRVLCRSLLQKLDRNLLRRKSERRYDLQHLPPFDPRHFYHDEVIDFSVDIDNPEYDTEESELTAHPFTPRQKAILEYIADCVSNTDLTDDDPIVAIAIARCYFEFRKTMFAAVDIARERANLTHFLTQIIS